MFYHAYFTTRKWLQNSNTPFAWWLHHYDDVIMSLMASQITSLTIVYSTSYSGVDERKYQSSASLAFVRGIHRGPVNSPHKRPVTRKMFPFDDVIMIATLEWQDTSWVMTFRYLRDVGISWGTHCSPFIQQHFHWNILHFVHPGSDCET